MKKVIYIILIVALVAGSGVGAFYYQQRNIDELNAKNKSLESDIEKLRAKNDEAVPEAEVPQTTNSTSYTSEKGVKVVVTTPVSESKVSSPLTVKGSVPGSWSFEAQFSVRLIDAQGNLLDESPAKLSGDWMTNKLVPFTATMKFGKGASKNGTLVLLKSNPSGLSSNNDSVVIPVTF